MTITCRNVTAERDARWLTPPLRDEHSFSDSPMSRENFDKLKGKAAAKAAQDAAKEKVGEAAEPLS